MKNIYLILTLMSIMLITACSSNKKVIYSMEDRSKPEWASLSRTVWFEGDTIKAIGYAEGSEKSNIAVLAQIADNNGKSEILRLINNKVGTIVENTQYGDSVNNKNFAFYGTEESQENIRNMLSKERFYQLVSIKNETEIPDRKIEFYSLIEIKKSDFNKALQESLWKQQDSKENLEKSVNSALDNVVGEN